MLSISINNNVTVSICPLHLKLPFDDCPTVAAADVDSVVCVCVCAITVSLLTIMIRGAMVPIASPKYVPGNYCLFINDCPCLCNN